MGLLWNMLYGYVVALLGIYSIFAQRLVLRTNLYDERFRGAPTIRFYCDFHTNDTVTPYGKFDLISDDKSVLMSALPDRTSPGIWSTEFYIHIGRYIRPFQKIQCRYGKRLSENSVSLPFYVCPDHNEACSDYDGCRANERDAKYCLITKFGTKPCTSITEQMCQNEDDSYRFCPVDVTGICKATLQSRNDIWFRTSAEVESCPEITTAPLTYKGRPIAYGQPFDVDPSEKLIRVNCPLGSAFYNQTFQTQLIDDINNNFPLLIPQTPCVDELAVQFGDVFNEGVAVYEMWLTASMTNQTQKAQFINAVVVFGTKINIKKYTFGALSCHFTAPVDNMFRVTTWWTQGRTGYQQLDLQGPSAKRYTGQFWDLFRVNQTDEYQCHALLEYKTCAPHQRFSQVISSERILFDVQNPQGNL
jgi:hypothetical protein